MTPDGEPKFLNACTGWNKSFEDVIWLGKKVYDLDRAIWQLQGRTREVEIFSDYVYDQPQNPKVPQTSYEIAYCLPTYNEETHEWAYKDVSGRQLDREKTEELKSHFYRLEGCDVAHGWLKRSALETEGLGYVADELEAHGVLGQEEDE